MHEYGSRASVVTFMSKPLGRNAPYCLTCHAALGEWFGASVRCESCDAVNLRVDHRTYWTRSPRALRTERWLRVGGTLLLIAATLALMASNATPHETGWKTFAVMGTLIPATLWWDLASLRTKRASRLRVEVLVPVLFLVASAGPVLWSLFAILGGKTTDLGFAVAESLGILLFVQPFLLGSWLLVTHVERLRRAAQQEPFRRVQNEAPPVGAGRDAPSSPPGAAQPHAVHNLRAAQGLLDARSSSSYRPLSGKDTYCLHCYAPMEPIKGASSRCEVCQRTTRRLDHGTFWSQSPRIMRIERCVKLALVGLALAGVVAVVMNARAIAMFTPWGGLFCIAVILVLSMLLWDLVGMISRHRSASRLDIVMPWIIAASGPAMTFAAFISYNPGYFKRGLTPGSPASPSWTFSLPFLYLGLITWVLRRSLLDWREQQLVRGLSAGRQRMIASLELQAKAVLTQE